MKLKVVCDGGVDTRISNATIALPWCYAEYVLNLAVCTDSTRCHVGSTRYTTMRTVAAAGANRVVVTL
jgi:hypothetical protein